MENRMNISATLLVNLIVVFFKYSTNLVLNSTKQNGKWLTFVLEELGLDDIRVLLDGLVVVGIVEEDEEGQALLRQLLGVLEGDLANQRSAFVGSPNVQLVVTVKLIVENNSEAEIERT